MENLNKKNFFSFALHNYNNPSCGGIAEFKDDLLRFKYIKRLIKKYIKTGQIKPRLLVNHLIGLNNIFNPEAISRLLFFRVDKSGWPTLKTVLEYLSLMPETVASINGTNINNTDISTDDVLLTLLIKEIELPKS